MVTLPKGIGFGCLEENSNETATVTFKMKADGISGDVRVTVRVNPSADKCIQEAQRGLAEFLRS